MGRQRDPSTLLIPRPDPSASEALYLQLVRAIEEGIRAGRLRVGQRLPAERALATDLGVSRTTVTGAYQELEARGLLRGHVGRGTVVVATPGDTGGAAIPWSQRASPLALQAMQASLGAPGRRPDVIAFDYGWPDPSFYPVEALEGLLDRLPGRGTPQLYTTAPPLGDPSLRETLSAWLVSRGIRATPDTIVVTAGAQQGLNVLARAFLRPGDVVLAETPTYLGALLAFRWAGADVVGVPLDHEGVQPDALEEAMVRYRPKLVYLIPTFQNPTGSVLGRERRRLVLELATRYRVPVVESDLYGEMFYEDAPPPSLKARDGAGVVIYQGSFSKIGVPGLRVGWLVAPGGALAPLTATKAFEDLHTATLNQRLAAQFLSSPHLERHLAAARAECRVRRDRMVTALHQHCRRLRFRIPSGGYYVWAELPAPLTADRLLPGAQDKGVAVRAGSLYSVDKGGDDHIRLCFAALDPARIAEGARRLGDALEEAWDRVTGHEMREPAPALSVV